LPWIDNLVYDLDNQVGYLTPKEPIMTFADLTLESAPADARRSLQAIRDHWGYLPSGAARMALSPETLNGFLQINRIFEATTLDEVAREVVVMTVATRNGCHVCVAIHTQRLRALDAHPGVVGALREQRPLDDPRLEAVRRFTLDALETSGAVTPEMMSAFLDQGYTQRNALEVVLGIGAYTLSTLANRMTGAPVDEPLLAFA
jgi:AhpD family alkylhydroperoxidase